MQDKKTLDKKMEVLDAIGGESDKEAIPAVREVMKAKEQEIKTHDDNALERLSGLNRWSIFTYNSALANLLTGRLSVVVDWPQGWKYVVKPDKIGVVLTMRYKDRLFRAGFKSTGDPRYDLNAVNMYIERAQNTIEKVERTEPKIIL